MIDMNHTQEMADVIHGAIAYSGIEQAVIGTPIVNRLHRILQSSLVYLTYPSNKVKRFEHSIGTMHLAGQFFFHSICGSEEPALHRFFGEVSQALIDWNQSLSQKDVFYIPRAVRQKYSGENVLNVPWPSCSLYLENMPANLAPEWILCYCVVYQAIRLAGLLHDVGHLPYSHVLEHALQSLYQKVLQIPEEERNNAHSYFLTVMAPYCTSPDGSPDPEFAIHEKLGQQFVDKIFECVADDLPKAENDQYYFLAAVFHFSKQILIARESENTIFSDLHRIVAGTLDCDRLDYCCRDEYCAGISKELFNYERIFRSLSILYRRPKEIGKPPENSERERCCFAPSTKALREIEVLLNRRWDIYTTINYHHSVHKHEILLQKVLTKLGLEEMQQSPEQPEDLDAVLPLRVSAIWQLVDQMGRSTPVEYLALQLDDSWLDTLLKHKYFERYRDTYLSFSQNGKDVMWHRLDELISVKKHYRSLMKRSGSFRQFDEYVYQELIRSGSPEFLKSMEIDPKMSHAPYVEQHGEYVFNWVLRKIAVDKELRSQFFRMFDQRVQDLIRQDGTRYRIADCFLSDCSFSMGIKQTDSLCITSPDQEARPFVGYSALYSVLSCEKRLLPSVHIYYLPQYDTDHGEYFTADSEQFLQDAAVMSGNTIIEMVNALREQANAPPDALTKSLTAPVLSAKPPASKSTKKGRARGKKA